MISGTPRRLLSDAIRRRAVGRGGGVGGRLRARAGLRPSSSRRQPLLLPHSTASLATSTRTAPAMESTSGASVCYSVKRHAQREQLVASERLHPVGGRKGAMAAAIFQLAAEDTTDADKKAAAPLLPEWWSDEGLLRVSAQAVEQNYGVASGALALGGASAAASSPAAATRASRRGRRRGARRRSQGPPRRTSRRPSTRRRSRARAARAPSCRRCTGASRFATLPSWTSR